MKPSSRRRVASALPGLIRLAVIGDVHRNWDPVQDGAALTFLSPDAAIFVGDFGEEVVDIVGQIAALEVPKAVILGNHDAWGALYRRGTDAGVKAQLELLGDAHVGYGSKQFRSRSGQPFSIVGARPFSDGNNSIDDCIRTLYGVDSLQASAAKIAAEVERQPAGQPVILVGHNGPTGLGKRRHDPCGKDFVPNAGDFGDRDLRHALDALAPGRSVPLVTFGHMHHSLHWRHGKGKRNMAAIEPDTGTIFLNAAMVPRERNSSQHGRLLHFLDVTIEGGAVTTADNLWLAGSQEAGFMIVEREPLLVSERQSDGGLLRKVFRAHDSTWTDFVPYRTPKGKTVDLSSEL